MRMYSADELDVMAEAYLKALDLLPVVSPTTALTRRAPHFAAISCSASIATGLCA